MTTINPSSLLGSIPSLADYLNKAGSNSVTNLGFTQYKTPAGTGGASTLQDSNGDTISLSPQAQALLAQAQQAQGTSPTSSSSATSSSGDNDVQSGAQKFVADFFNDSGLDADNTLSDETLSLVKGLAGMISDMQSPTQNAAVDNITRSYSKGARTSYTLQEDNHTISFMVKYTGGKPASLTVTNVTGLKAETAVITLGKGTDGTIATAHVASEIGTYNQFGSQTSSAAGENLDFDLYAHAAA